MPLIYRDKIFGVVEFLSARIQDPTEDLLLLMKNICSSISEFIQQAHNDEQFQIISQHDILTGLLNRSAFEESLDNAIAKKTDDKIVIFILDIDRFKFLNVALGYNNGNIIINAVAARLKASVDQKKTLIARLGADKFILYFPINDSEDPLNYANKIKRSFNPKFKVARESLSLTLSIGIAIYPEHGSSSNELILNANHALVYAKKLGGNKILYFTKKLSTIASEKLSIQTDVREALGNNQFFLNFQPQIDLKTGMVCGAEALVRWQHPTRGLVSPATFITYAEQADLIIPLNELVMRMVFQTMKENWSGPPISINISAQQFNDGYHLVEYLQSLVKEFSVNPKDIELEITESVIMEDVKHNIAIMETLHHLGFQFAIDDFGTGFSSFNYLHRVAANKVKIDISFIKGLPQNQDNVIIVKSMILMLHSLGKKIVAEGAETLAEVEFLKQENCDIIQGYYFYKPMSSNDFLSLIGRPNQS